MNKASQFTACVVLAYILLIVIVMHGGQLGPDTYYYWQWSRHLDWSYYDGPPMIAYAMRFMTFLFGNAELGLLSLGLSAVVITSYFIYQTGRRLFDSDHVASIAVMIWLSGLVAMRHFFLLITYDTTLVIFWSATYYFLLQVLLTKKARYYYLCGVSVGLMMLSKYTTALLGGSMLLTCALYPSYRFIFRSKHLYFGLLISFVLFSPVLYWNMRHDWISFSYQLNKGVAGYFDPIDGIKTYLQSTMINFNFYFAALLFILFLHGKRIFSNSRLGFVAIPTVCVWVFFFLCSVKSVPVNGDSWNSECFLSASLLLGFYFAKIAKRWILYGLIFVGFVPALLYLLMSRFPEINPLPGWSRVYASEALLRDIPEGLYANKVIYHDGQYWLSSFITYYLPSHPMVYSTNFTQGNQYYFWNRLYQPVKSGEKIILFSTHPVITDMHYQGCQLLMQKSELQKNYFKSNAQWNLYVFDCVYR